MLGDFYLFDLWFFSKSLLDSAVYALSSFRSSSSGVQEVDLNNFHFRSQLFYEQHDDESSLKNDKSLLDECFTTPNLLTTLCNPGYMFQFWWSRYRWYLISHYINQSLWFFFFYCLSACLYVCVCVCVCLPLSTSLFWVSVCPSLPLTDCLSVCLCL